MLPVAVSGLVQVHEVHVDLVIGDLQIILGCQMAVWLLQVGKAVDPHLGAEGMAPGDDAGTGIVVVCFLDDLRNLGIGHCSDLID